jgi:hypothetical protein
MAGEMDDLRDIHTLRIWSQVPNLHVFDHATAKRAHGQLPCETNSATWRRRIVSRLSCQTREWWRAIATNEVSEIEEP